MTDPAARREYDRKRSKERYWRGRTVELRSCEMCGATLPPHNGRGRKRKICDNETCRRRYKTQKQRVYSQPGYKPKPLSPEARARANDRARVRRKGKRNSWEWNLKHVHDMTPEHWHAMWVEQHGNCYLCEQPLSADRAKVAIDHDHSHCGPHRSCRYCRRGLAHHGCNTAIGSVGEDASLLRLIAGNLERAKKLTASLLVAAPQQQALLFDADAAQRDDSADDDAA